MDSGSPISFVKLKYILGNAVIKVNENDLEIKFHGLNQSDLVVLETMNVDICINNRLVYNLCLIVVLDFTTKTPVVLGKDILNVLGLRLDQEPQERINIGEIMNIDVPVCEVDKADSLYVNPAVTLSVQQEVRDFFREKYLYSKRPSESEDKAEIALTLRDHNPFHSTPRRLSYSEKYRNVPQNRCNWRRFVA